MDALSLFHRYRDDVYRLAVNYTSSPREAEDVSRTVFWKRAVKDIFLSSKTDKPPQGVLRLPPKYRVILYLRYYEDFTTGEIARLLQIPQGTAAARLSRGRGQLEKLMRKGAA